MNSIPSQKLASKRGLPDWRSHFWCGGRVSSSCATTTASGDGRVKRRTPDTSHLLQGVEVCCSSATGRGRARTARHGAPSPLAPRHGVRSDWCPTAARCSGSTAGAPSWAPQTAGPPWTFQMAHGGSSPIAAAAGQRSAKRMVAPAPGDTGQADGHPSGSPWVGGTGYVSASKGSSSVSSAATWTANSPSLWADPPIRPTRPRSPSRPALEDVGGPRVCSAAVRGCHETKLVNPRSTPQTGSASPSTGADGSAPGGLLRSAPPRLVLVSCPCRSREMTGRSVRWCGVGTRARARRPLRSAAHPTRSERSSSQASLWRRSSCRPVSHLEVGAPRFASRSGRLPR